MTPDRVEVDFDQHSEEYRTHYPDAGRELREQCPVAWSNRHGGFWVVTGHEQLSAMSKRPDLLSNDHDPGGDRNGYDGISIPARGSSRGGFLEMDPPEQSEYRRVLNPYLSPAAVQRWEPLVADFTRACIDEVIEIGRLDFVDDLANVVPAVLTMAMLGLPLADWIVYCEPTHMQVYTPPDSPNFDTMLELTMLMHRRLAEFVQLRKTEPRPGMITALLNARVMGEPLPDADVVGTVSLLIGGGFDTTTSLLAGSLDWLDDHVDDRHRLVEDPGAPGHRHRGVPPPLHPRPGWRAHRHPGLRDRGLPVLGARPRVPVVRDVQPRPCGVRRSRRDRARPVPQPPLRIRPRRASVHRFEPRRDSASSTWCAKRCAACPTIASTTAGRVQYESIGVINGYQHLPATFTPGRREGPPLTEVMDAWQERLDAEPAPAVEG